EPEVPVEYKPESGIALMHGCLGHIYRDAKDVGRDIRQQWIREHRHKNITILGTQDDYQNYWQHNNLNSVKYNLLGKTTLLEAIQILATCKSFISNDTRLSHVAAAIGMPGTVYW